MRKAIRQRLIDQTNQALDRLAATQSRIDDLTNEEPELGDLFLLDGAASFPVEWAVLERNEANGYRIVPADGLDLAGSKDVIVPEDSPRGPLVLRCGFPVWIEASMLASGRRTGRLGAAELEEASARLRILGRGAALSPSPRAVETDLEPRYREWIESTLEPAISSLSASHREDSKSLADLPTEEKAPEGRRGIHLYRFAASVLLAVTAGSLGALLWQRQEIDRLRLTNVSSIDQWDQEMEALKTEYRHDLEAQRAQLEDLDRDSRAERERLRQRIFELERQAPSAAKGPEGNLPFLLLAPDRLVRGRPEAVAVDSSASFFLLILQIDRPRLHDGYHLEILDETSGSSLWRSGELHKVATAEVSAAVPMGFLPEGEYNLKLSGSREGKVELVHRYQLRLVYR